MITEIVELIENISKFVLCVLRCQFGKTFTCIGKIIDEIKRDVDLGKSIHIVFTMNTLKNNEQFSKRLHVIETMFGKGSICVFSSKYQGKYTWVKSSLELKGLCSDKDTCPRVVVMCSNKTRFDDGYDFINVINKNKYNSIDRVFAYYDELHIYIDSVRLQIEEMTEFDVVKGITALTATNDKLFLDTESGFWSRIQIIYLDDLNDSNYVGCNDMDWICIDNYFDEPYVRPGAFDYDKLDEQTLGFIKHVLIKYPEILNDSTRSFIPAHKRRISHIAVRELIFYIKNNAVVIVLNGVEKNIQYKDKNNNINEIPLTTHTDEVEEVSETISRLVLKNNLQTRPIVVTGLLAVGTGQTLTHKDLGSFTSAIFGHLDLENSDMYQLFGRTTGRMKGWDTYVQTKIYCPTKIMQRCKVMEECAKNMFENHNGSIVTEKDYRAPMNTMQIGQSAIENIRTKKDKNTKKEKKDKNSNDKDYKKFDTQEDAIKWGYENLKIKFNKRKSNLVPSELLINGMNPSVEQLTSRLWGINPKNKARMYPTNDDKWCIYWKPSLFNNNL